MNEQQIATEVEGTLKYSSKNQSESRKKKMANLEDTFKNQKSTSQKQTMNCHNVELASGKVQKPNDTVKKWTDEKAKNGAADDRKRLDLEPKFGNSLGETFGCKYPTPVGQTLKNCFTIEKHFNTQIFRHHFLATFCDREHLRRVFVKMKSMLFPKEIALLEREFKIYKQLEMLDKQANLRIAKAFFLCDSLCYKTFSMELLGPNLHDLWSQNGRSLSIRALAQVAYQLICSMKFFHDRGLIFQNIHPDHFVYGPSGTNRWNWMFCVDLKYCNPWCVIDYNSRLPNTYLHIPDIVYDKQPIIGTPIRFWSINAHKCHEQSRRDDIESICYLLLYLYYGKLPWIQFEGIVDQSERHAAIVQCKETEAPLLFANLLSEFSEMYAEVKRMSFGMRPNYKKWAQSFQTVQKQIGFRDIYDLYDWNELHRPKYY